MIAHTQIWLIGRGLDANARCVVQNLNVHAEFSAVLPKSLENPFRVVTVTPLQGLTPLAYYRAFVRGGPSGVREESGNWLESDLNARFRIGSTPDFTAPVVTATVNGIDTSRVFSTGQVRAPSTMYSSPSLGRWQLSSQ